MRVIIDVEPDHYERLLALIRTKRAVSLSQFMRFAIENQLTLEEGGERVIDSGRPVATVGNGRTDGFVRTNVDPWKGIRFTDIQWSPLSGKKTAAHLSTEPIWGQYNRLFPLKVSSRKLAALEAMKGHPLGQDSAIIGEVIGSGAPQVRLRTTIGTARLLDMPSGELLPRIC